MLKKIAGYGFYILFFATMLWVTCAAFAGSSQPVANVLAVSAALCVFFAGLYRFILCRADALAARPFCLLISGLFALFILAATAFGCLTMTHPISDLEVLCDAVSYWISNGHLMQYSYYFTVCANTLGNAIFLYAIFLPLSWFGLQMGSDAAECIAIFCNVLMVALAVFLMWRIAARQWRTQGQQLLFLILSFSFAPFYLWAHRYYSDTLSMPFAPLAIWLYLRATETKKHSHCVLYSLLCGVCLWVGYFIKGSVLIALPALIIFALFTQKWRKTARILLPMTLAVCLCFAGWEIYRHNNNWISYQNEAIDKYPTTMWLLYGAHGDGNYNDADVEYLRGFDNYEQRSVAAKERLAEYYSSYTPKSYLAFLTTKFTATWSDAKYSVDNYLPASRHGNWTHYFIMEGFPFYPLTSYYCNGWHYAFLLMMLFSTAAGVLRLNQTQTQCHQNNLLPLPHITAPKWDMCFLLRICLFGLVVFLCFWETKPRYLLSFTPFFPLFFAQGLLTGMQRCTTVTHWMTNALRQGKRKH